jgi:hypothetical protein
MMKKLSAALLATAVVSTPALAANQIEEVWDCNLREGKTVDQVSAINQTWMKFVNSAVDGGGIASRIVTPLVGELGHFYFVDSFPSLDAWAAMKNAMGTEQGQKIEAEIDALVECTSNRLYRSRD